MRSIAMLGVAAACGGGGATTKGPAGGDTGTGAGTASTAGAGDQRLVHLQTMTDLLVLLAGEVERITTASEASPERCAALEQAVVTWGEEHYEAYEVADAEGTYLGLTDD